MTDGSDSNRESLVGGSSEEGADFLLLEEVSEWSDLSAVKVEDSEVDVDGRDVVWSDE